MCPLRSIVITTATAPLGMMGFYSVNVQKDGMERAVNMVGDHKSLVGIYVIFIPSLLFA